MTSTAATVAPASATSEKPPAPTPGTPGPKKRPRSILGLTLNGREREDLIPDGLLLLDYLREVAGLTGTKQGCDGGECGACTVLVDGQPRLSCSTLAVQVQGRHVETVEGLTEGGTMSPLQQAFHESLGAQCGFCTPGMITTAEALLRRNPNPSVDEIKTAMGGNLCRCTGYVKIIESVQVAAAARAAAGGGKS
ncbi:MAG TPA: 4-hydroxybenzoyl-CoA reductase subunit gamma [Rubrivivax sp.]|nr:4-hydroxybenzoyl-CoA reductase subunit gamma [Rubrivivax sp.]